MTLCGPFLWTFCLGTTTTFEKYHTVKSAAEAGQIFTEFPVEILMGHTCAQNLEPAVRSPVLAKRKHTLCRTSRLYQAHAIRPGFNDTTEGRCAGFQQKLIKASIPVDGT